MNSFDPNTGATYLPVYGDDFLPDSPQVALNTGKIHNINLLIGNNRDEGSMLITSAFPQFFSFLEKKKISKVNSPTAEDLLKSVLEKYLKDAPGTDLVTQTILGSLNTDDYRKILKSLRFSGGFLTCLSRCLLRRNFKPIW